MRKKWEDDYWSITGDTKGYTYADIFGSDGLDENKMRRIEEAAMKNLEKFEKSPKIVPATPKLYKKLSILDNIINNTIIL